MTEPAIRVTGLSKKYRLGVNHVGSLQELVSGWTRKLLGRPRAAATSDAFSRDEFWALKDVSFDVEPGEIVGIIGRNGAGKSTLLKILSRITRPTAGEIGLNGRVASLLEVGTGFHPDLTGHENIFLNGAILGMTRSEIRRLLPEIVEFADISDFLDTPVKHYSSGMYVRLAFAVAAHLQPEILIVDEVLAVGDAEFQKKCLGKLKDSSESGRTVLFVSHQMGTVLQLCTRAVCMERGRVAFTGAPQEAVDYYLGSAVSEDSGRYIAPETTTGSDVRIERVESADSLGAVRARFNHDESFQVVVRYTVKRKVPGAAVRLVVTDRWSRNVFVSDTPLDYGMMTETGQMEAVVSVPSWFLRPGRYVIGTSVFLPNVALLDAVIEAFSIWIADGGSRYAVSEGVDYGCVFGPCDWSFRGCEPSEPPVERI